MSEARKNGIVHDVLQPPGWPAPRGYVNGVSASGRMVFTGGLVGWDTAGGFPAGMAAYSFQPVWMATMPPDRLR